MFSPLTQKLKYEYVNSSDVGIISHCIPVSDDHVVHLIYTLSWVNCISKPGKNKSPSPWNLLHHRWYRIGSFFWRPYLNDSPDFSPSQFNSGDEFWWSSRTRESGPETEKETAVHRGDHVRTSAGPPWTRPWSVPHKLPWRCPSLSWSYLCRPGKEVCMKQGKSGLISTAWWGWNRLVL